jgi:hypothetical protein
LPGILFPFCYKTGYIRKIGTQQTNLKSVSLKTRNNTNRHGAILDININSVAAFLGGESWKTAKWDQYECHQFVPFFCIPFHLFILPTLLEVE